MDQYIDEIQRFSTEHIDRSRLQQFILMTSAGTPVFRLELKPGRKFLYRLRTAIGQGVGVIERIHIVGWEKDEVRRLAFIRESDMSIEYGDFVTDPDEAKKYPWRYPFERLPADEVVVGGL